MKKVEEREKKKMDEMKKKLHTDDESKFIQILLRFRWVKNEIDYPAYLNRTVQLGSQFLDVQFFRYIHVNVSKYRYPGKGLTSLNIFKIVFALN